MDEFSIKILKKILVVDDDKLCLNLIENQVKSLGASQVLVAESGDQASELINETDGEPFTLIIQDWKLHGLSGIGLFNRVRLMPHYETTPILVVSGFVDRSDFKILEEFPCTTLVEKPFTTKTIKDRIQQLASEKEWYAQNEALLNEIEQALDGNIAKLEQIVKSVLKKSPHPTPVVLMAVRALVRAGSLKTAQKLLELLHEKNPKSAIVATELGKVLMRRKDFKEALPILSQADKLSAGNIMRLCMMGEAQLNVNDFNAAQSSFKKALGIDPQNQTARSGLLVADNMVRHKSHFQNLADSFPSLLNTVGIAMIRSGKFDKGIEQYQNALPFIQQPVDQAKVAFNLGLGYLKWGHKKSALEWFKKSTDMGLTHFGKAQGYVTRILSDESEKEPVSSDEEATIEATEKEGATNEPDNVNEIVHSEKISRPDISVQVAEEPKDTQNKTELENLAQKLSERIDFPRSS